MLLSIVYDKLCGAGVCADSTNSFGVFANYFDWQSMIECQEAESDTIFYMEKVLVLSIKLNPNCCQETGMPINIGNQNITFPTDDNLANKVT